MAKMQSLSKPELISLLETARHNSERDWLMILVAYWHGLRVSELIALTDKSFRDDQITVKRLKGSEKTIHNLRESKEDILNEKKHISEYLKNKTGRIFPMTRFNFYYLMRKYGKEAGLTRDQSHPHALKHSIAYHAVDNIVITKLAKYLGHKNLNSTYAYTKPTDRSACEAMDKAFGT